MPVRFPQRLSKSELRFSGPEGQHIPSSPIHPQIVVKTGLLKSRRSRVVWFIPFLFRQRGVKGRSASRLDRLSVVLWCPGVDVLLARHSASSSIGCYGACGATRGLGSPGLPRAAVIAPAFMPGCCTQVADWFSGRRPNDLPSPGQRPGNQGDDSPRGPKARSFTGAVQAVSWQMAGPLALDHLPSPVYPARWAGLGKPAGRWPCIEEATSGTKTVAFINRKMPSKTRFSTAQVKTQKFSRLGKSFAHGGWHGLVCGRSNRRNDSNSGL